MDIKELKLIALKTERDYSERQVRQSIKTLRGILDRVEYDLDIGEVNADNGLQGNEWRLYKELSNLERYYRFIKLIEESF